MFLSSVPRCLVIWLSSVKTETRCNLSLDTLRVVFLVQCFSSTPNRQEQRLSVNPFLLAISFCNLLATLLPKSGSNGWWALELRLILGNGGNTWLKYLTWLSSKEIASNWSWLNGAEVSLDADMVNELVACIPVTFLHRLHAVVYGDVLVFISLGLMWPRLKTPSESKQ